MSEFKQLKEKLNVHASFSDAEWQELRSNFKAKRLKKGDFFVKENSICREIAFINKGCMRYYYNNDGEEVSIAFFVEREFVSAFPSFLTGKQSLQIIDAIEDSELLVISEDRLKKMLQHYGPFEKAYRHMIENSLVDTQNRLAQYLLMNPEERYLHFMKHFPHLLNRIPQYYIASYLGITAVSLSRIRKRIFTEKGE